MAEVSLARIPDVELMQQEAKAALTSLKTSIDTKEKIETALHDIQEKADFELTPALAKEVDETINDLGGLKIKKGGIIRIDGTESFGVNIRPADWRASRVAGLESMLEDVYRDIKRWANQLQENFDRRWIELTTSLETLESRTINIQNALDVSTNIRLGCDKVEYNHVLVKTLTKPGVALQQDLVKFLTKEIDFISTITKLYEIEMTRMKNGIVKFFGTPKANNLTDVGLSMPKILDVRVKNLKDNADGRYLDMSSKPMLGGRVVVGRVLNPSWIKENYKGPDDNEMYMEALGYCGFHVDKGESKETTSGKLDVLSLTQLFSMLEIAKELIQFIKTMNNEYNKLDMDKFLVKDNLETLKRSPETPELKAAFYQYIVSNYQYNVNSFRSELSAYLTVLTSHILTAITLNLECYDAE